MSSNDPETPRHMETAVTQVGRDPQKFDGAVNIPPIHASTIVFPDAESIRANVHPAGSHYGRAGTSTTRAIEEAVATLEGGDRTVSYPSGAAAVAGVLSCFLDSGDHILVADNVYGPTRRFCDEVLSRTGVAYDFFDPALGKDTGQQFRQNTRAVFLESPGSETFEVCDVPGICAVAHDRDILTILDNTWSGGWYFKPFEHGVDISINAGTKYIGGHADTMLGFATTTNALYPALKQNAANFGYCVGPEVCYLGLRGLRTIGVRMPRHYETGLRLAEWLAGQDEVSQVLHPALPSCPGHDFWKRDFTGASGLFGVVLKQFPQQAVNAMLDGMELYSMGYSWGGYESLMIPTEKGGKRTASRWPDAGPTIRIHAGLENFEDLRCDLQAGLRRLRDAS